MAGAKHGAKLADLAEACGLSLRVVNAVMTGYSGSVRYSQKTKEKILETAIEMGYRPNRFARNLQNGCCGTIAVLVENFFDINEMTMDSIIRAANQHSKMILLEKVGPDNPCPRCFSEKIADGFIAIGQIPDDVLKKIDRACSPCIFVNTNKRKGSNCMNFAEEGAMKLAVERFAALGRKHIAFISNGRSDHYFEKARRLGLESEIRKRGFHKLKILENSSQYFNASFLDQITSFLKVNPEIDAVLLSMDAMAPAFYDAADRTGRRIPSDIAVISVNNSEFSVASRPSMTSLGVNRAEVGWTAVGKLISMMEGKEDICQNLKYSLFQRNSA
ncbi:MAG TPA: hypothetical protein DET40_19880 [Lentisphaeria bacterium]|nr:MAG: hypothetical protein A2X45_00870 [Lentisphaerae bacterium GWF2_50_93]HCE45810.1 hypothetical protein [Lentisphaeria bacterium]